MFVSNNARIKKMITHKKAWTKSENRSLYPDELVELLELELGQMPLAVANP